MKTFNFTVVDPAGMHARPASILSKEAAKYKSDISLKSNDRKGNLKSILGVMSLGIKSGQLVEIIIDGEDESIALEALEAIVTSEGLC